MNKKKIIVAIALLTTVSMFAKNLNQKIANMFMLGFYNTSLNANSKIIKDICHDGLGGVILFDRHPTKIGQSKNISSKSQLKKLTYVLSNSCRHKPLIAVDQEGGRVQRLQRRYGFYGKYPKASIIGRGKAENAQIEYMEMADELSSIGINYNLAPVADMAVNRKNRVIFGLGRSYGATSERVAKFDKIFIKMMHESQILTALKHFPGHGSSFGDTHRGFVDVSRTWTLKELEPFQSVIDSGLADSIMVAHVFNKRFDNMYPASLSEKTINDFLRNKMKYHGVVITDDLQMNAISKHYKLRETIKLAINAGDDILLFGNQLSPSKEVNIQKLVSIVKSLIKSGEVKQSSIDSANKRIDKMKHKIGM